MEGYTLIRTLREILNEPVGGGFMNDRTSYDYIYHAVQDFNVRTHWKTDNATITVTAGTTNYALPADYAGLALADNYSQPYVKHTYNGTDTFIYVRDYSSIILANSFDTAQVSQGFAITDADLADNITGTATSTTSLSNGESILNDTTASFLATVAVGDYIHNTTDGSDGIVVHVTSNLSIICALFEGTNNFWTSGDAYVIIPQQRYNLVLTPITSASATLTIPYIVKPKPVYSEFRSYQLPNNSLLPIVHYAAFLYKFKDTQPDFGNAFYKSYDMFARKIAAEMRKAVPSKAGFHVNLSKMNRRSTGGSSWQA